MDRPTTRGLKRHRDTAKIARNGVVIGVACPPELERAKYNFEEFKVIRVSNFDDDDDDGVLSTKDQN